MESVFDLLIDRVQDYGKYKGILKLDKDSCDNYISVSDIKKIIRDVEEEDNNGWIACSERLPEIGQEVLCCGKAWHGYKIFVGKYRDADKYKAKPYFDWKQNGFPEVIAWQPLPEPYKGE